MSTLAPLPGMGGDFAKGASGPANVYDTSPAGLGLNPAYLAGGASASALASAGAGTVGTHASLPGSATTGATYYETDTGILRIWDGAKWVAIQGAVLIAESSPNNQTVTFSAIPQTFQHLLVIWKAAYNGAAEHSLVVQFNGDATAVYDWQSHESINQTSSPGGNTAQTSMILGVVGTNASLMNGLIVVPAYQWTSAGIGAVGLYGGRATTNRVGVMSGRWGTGTPAPVSSITLSADGLTFLNGSKFSLLGVM